MLPTRTKSPKHRKRRQRNDLPPRYVGPDQIIDALEAEVVTLEDRQTGLKADIDVLEDVGLGSTGRAEALRRILEQSYAEQNRLRLTAADMRECGRTVLQEECGGGHKRHKPFLCNKPTCPDCAARRSRRLTRIYTARVAGALMRSPPRGVKARLVTLPLRPRDVEDHRAAFNRCRPLVMSALRLCFGVPQTAAEWRHYFELYPITSDEYARVPEETPGGHRRKMKTRLRMAQTHRRRYLKSQPARRYFGAVVSIEFGESGALAHGHALVVGKYAAQRELSQAWRLVTGGTSYVAHIRAVDNLRAGVAEVCKYLAKFGAHTAPQLVELYRSTLMFSRGPHGTLVARQRRRLEPLGILRGTLEEEHPPPVPCAECGLVMRVVGSISWSMWQLGVRDVPEDRRFMKRPREPD